MLLRPASEYQWRSFNWVLRSKRRGITETIFCRISRILIFMQSFGPLLTEAHNQNQNWIRGEYVGIL